MNPSYIFIIISVLNLGLSVYILRKLSKKSINVVADVVPTVKTIPLKVEQPKIEPITSKESIPTIEVVGVDGSELMNVWKLKINGNPNVNFDVRIKWSDKTRDKLTGSAPMIFDFKKSRGITPIHVTNHNHSITHVWELNGFDWS